PRRPRSTIFPYTTLFRSMGAGKELPRCRDIADVRGRLAGIDRETIEPEHLGALDFGVPIGALDQTHHDLAVKPGGRGFQPVDQRDRKSTRLNSSHVKISY